MFSIGFTLESISDHKRTELNKKLEDRISKYRKLEIIDGKFQQMAPIDDDEKAIFDKIDAYTNSNSDFYTEPDNFIGNDIVQDTNQAESLAGRYTDKVDPFNDIEKFSGKAFQFENPANESPEKEINKRTMAIPETLNELTRDGISHNITEFHVIIFNCLETHSRSSSFNENSFEQIKEDCLGKKMVRLKEFYNDIQFQIRQFLYNQISNQLMDGICQDNFLVCVEYVRAIQFAAELDLLLEPTILANAEFLAEVIGEAKMNFLFRLTKPNIQLYQNLLDELEFQKDRIIKIIEAKSEEHQDYSVYKPKLKPEIEDNSPPNLDELEKAIKHSKDVPKPFQFDRGFKKVYATIKKPHYEIPKNGTKPKNDEDDFQTLPVRDKFGGRIRRPVDFPANSEELDKLHKKAQDLLKFRLNENSKLPTSPFYRKK